MEKLICTSEIIDAEMLLKNGVYKRADHSCLQLPPEHLTL